LGYVSNGDDCDDDCASCHPGATEVCDSRDNDCDGQADEGGVCDQPRTWYRDADGDGYGDPNVTAQAVQQPSGYVSNDDDCDDDCASCHLGGTEVCDDRDNDCDGQVDEGGVCDQPRTWYRDSDGDGYGDSSATTQAVRQPSGYVSNDDDCDDNDASVHPGATEVCDGKDNDCNGRVDDGDIGTWWYRDADGDGLGSPNIKVLACSQPPGYVANADDPNDNAGQTRTWYRDADGDGYGNPNQSKQANEQPTGYVANDDDCNDSAAGIHPGATDIAGDGVDQDCDGTDPPVTSCGVQLCPTGALTMMGLLVAGLAWGKGRVRSARAR
jgi:hypothetical protein